MSITFTIDLEDPTGCYAANGRYVGMTHRLLDLCDEFRRRATFFTVGRVAEAAPRLVHDIARRGHEIAFHSHAHVSLTEENPARFRAESAQDKGRLEQLAGKSVIGFRAPRFSLTPKSMWALNILAELGFRYSSSIMPTRLSLFGFAGAPSTPFEWPNGMIEFPLPVAPFGPARVPYLGGIYLYVMPFLLVRRWAKNADADDVLWTYAHPYDFDREESFAPMPNTPTAISYILWKARKKAEPKIRRVLKLGNAPPLGERIEHLKSLDTYS
jgi:polysaccharide deacetylase family protein (PEP-CTERM system associated)